MTDREMLELAALAAGYEEPNWPPRYDWNPLADDGDALRLAVRIPACIVIDNEMKWCGVHLGDERGKYDIVEHFGAWTDAAAAATRLAITRAAAEVGRKMREGKG